MNKKIRIVHLFFSFFLKKKNNLSDVHVDCNIYYEEKKKKIVLNKKNKSIHK